MSQNTRMFRTVRAALLILFAALLALGCNSNNGPVLGGKARPKVYSKVVSLSPSTSETYFAHQKYENLIGRTAACDWPYTMASVPIVAQVKPDYEKIAQLKPNMILYDKELYTDADIAKIKALGIETFEWDPKDLNQYRDQLINLTLLLGGETNTSLYLDKVYQQEESAKARYADSPEGKANKQLTMALIIPGANGQHMWDGVDSFQANCLRAVKVEPVGPAGNRFVPLDAEALIKADPDRIILAGENLNDFLNDARFASLKAVKNNGVLGIKPGVALRRGGRVDIFIEALSKAAYGAK